ncbi:MAG: BON domain-containing protein [Alphaproteobacteria bacterium]|nr:BON domain-containing protein [Alphaproteobacteria bacterium]
MKTFLIRSTLALAMVATLPACAPLMVGGMVGGAMVASDRRTSGIQLEDENIELKASSRLREMMGSRGHISFTSYNRQVLITGEVPSAQDRDYAFKLVSEVENVRKVFNELVVGPNSTLTERSTDSLITAKVKAQMVDSKDIFANAYKIVTERGVVYLMGRVTQREADRATEVARQVSGVKKVVRIFEILTEAELNALLPAPSQKLSAQTPCHRRASVCINAGA